MNKARCSLELYSQFLFANQNRFSGVELARVSPVVGMAHDSVSRFLNESNFTPSDLWRHVSPMVEKEEGYLIGDDTLLDKPRSRKNELARVQYSGNHHKLINGICLVNLLWTGGAFSPAYVPVDYRHYDKTRDDRTKNDHYLDMLTRAKSRGFKPKYVLNDSWYASIANMKHIDSQGWRWIMNLKSSRQISVAKGFWQPMADLALTNKQVRLAWLKGYGRIAVCKTVAKDGSVTYLASNDLSLLDYDEFVGHWRARWDIEGMHKGIKQTTGIAKNSATKAGAQKTHIFASYLTFAKLEKSRQTTGETWYEQKAEVLRPAVRAYLSSTP